VFYRVAADITVIIHLLWIIFLIFGAFPGRRHLWIKRIHITGLSFAFVIQIIGWYCPLTYLEVWLRMLPDNSPHYSGSFIVHYIEKIVYIKLPAKAILIMTVFLFLISTGLYLYKPGKTGGHNNERK
jgi:TRAP-type uncharacterized transport system fused permease subunit